MAKTLDLGPHGVVVIDKPAGWTSHDVVAKSRGVLGTRKVGHSGTLDPDATGVLVLGVGKATRLLRFLTELPKSYVGEIVLGTETDTLDAAGEITATHDMAGVTDEAVRAAAAALTGPIEQIPPMVSAVKIDGKRLHQLAREGKEVEREPRPVTVYRYDVEPVEGEPGVWRCEVDCSSGTYVRTLAADLGTALGGGAHLRSLRRTAVGGYTLDDAGTIDEPVVLPIAAAVRHLSSVVADEAMAVDVSHGKRLERERLGVGEADGPWAVLDEAGDLLAVYEAHKGATKPAVVIPR
ncbi:MAG: tRNA pseudouridine(55) synthase TruB [Acidimicrobiales bacterium]|nr:tRNA pseudouridine(55) synthase TruB [Acidimicrobiales bacterium]